LQAPRHSIGTCVFDATFEGLGTSLYLKRLLVTVEEPVAMSQSPQLLLSLVRLAVLTSAHCSSVPAPLHGSERYYHVPYHVETLPELHISSFISIG
jgi:hypothetical protein